MHMHGSVQPHPASATPHCSRALPAPRATHAPSPASACVVRRKPAAGGGGACACVPGGGQCAGARTRISCSTACMKRTRALQHQRTHLQVVCRVPVCGSSRAAAAAAASCTCMHACVRQHSGPHASTRPRHKRAFVTRARTWIKQHQPVGADDVEPHAARLGRQQQHKAGVLQGGASGVRQAMRGAERAIASAAAHRCPFA